MKIRIAQIFFIFSLFIVQAYALDTSLETELRSSSLLDGASGSVSLAWEQARDVATDSQGNMIIVGGSFTRLSCH